MPERIDFFDQVNKDSNVMDDMDRQVYNKQNESIQGLGDGISYSPMFVMTTTEDIIKRFNTLDAYAIEILNKINTSGVSNVDELNKLFASILKDKSSKQSLDPKFVKMLQIITSDLQQNTKEIVKVHQALKDLDLISISRKIDEARKCCTEFKEYEKDDDRKIHEEIAKLTELVMAKNAISKSPVYNSVSDQDRHVFQHMNDMLARMWDKVLSLSTNVGNLVLHEKEEEQKDKNLEVEIDRINRKLDNVLSVVQAYSKIPKDNNSVQKKESDTFVNFTLNIASDDDFTNKSDDVIKSEPTKDNSIVLKNPPPVTKDEPRSLPEVKVIERNLDEGFDIAELSRYVQMSGHINETMDANILKVYFSEPLKKFFLSKQTEAELFFSEKNGFLEHKAGFNPKIFYDKMERAAKTDVLDIKGEKTPCLNKLTNQDKQELVLFNLYTVSAQPYIMQFGQSAPGGWSFDALKKTFPKIQNLGDIRTAFVQDTLGSDNDNFIHAVISKVYKADRFFEDSKSLSVPFRNFSFRSMLCQNNYDLIRQLSLASSTIPQYKREYEYFCSLLVFLQWLQIYSMRDGLEMYRSLWALELDNNDRKSMDQNLDEWVKGGAYPFNYVYAHDWKYGTSCQRGFQANTVVSNFKLNSGKNGYTNWFSPNLWAVKDSTKKLINPRDAKIISTLIYESSGYIDYSKMIWKSNMTKFESISPFIKVREYMPAILLGLASHYYTLKRVNLRKVFSDFDVSIDQIVNDFTQKFYEVKETLLVANPDAHYLPKNVSI